MSDAETKRASDAWAEDWKSRKAIERSNAADRKRTSRANRAQDIAAQKAANPNESHLLVRRERKRGPKPKDTTNMTKEERQRYLNGREKRLKYEGKRRGYASEITTAKAPAAIFRFDEQALCYDSTSTKTMEADKGRVAFYRKALQAHSANQTVLDIGTGNNGLLAGIALEARATKVIAVDIRRAAARDAEIALQRFRDRAVVIHGNIRTLANPLSRATRYQRDQHKARLSMLKEVAVVVHEVFGTIASEEGIVQIVRDLRPCLQHSSDALQVDFVPSVAYTMVSPVTLPLVSDFAKRCVVSQDRRLMMGYIRCASQFHLAVPMPAEKLNFSELPDKRQTCVVEFKTQRQGKFAALHLYLHLVTKMPSSARCNGIAQLTSGGSTSNWEDILVCLARPVDVKKGATVRIEFHAEYRDQDNHYCVKVLAPKVRKMWAV